MNDLKKFMKSTGIYLIGNILTKGMSFVLLPIYTTYLSPQEFGHYDLMIAYNTLFMSVLFLDIWNVILRYIFDYDESEIHTPISTGFMIFMISNIIYIFIVLGLGSFLNLTDTVYLLLVGVLTNLHQIFGYIARALRKNKEFVISGIISSLIMLISNVILLVLLNYDYRSLYISSILGMVIGIFYLYRVAKLKNQFSIFYIDMKLMKDMFIYALPLSLNSAAYWFLTGFNRVIISSRLTVLDNGIYAVAMKFSAIIQLLTTGFQMAWQELSYSKVKMNRNEMGTFYERAFKEYSVFLLLGISVALPLINITYEIIVGQAFIESMALIPLVLVSTYFISISLFQSTIINTLKKNQLIFITSLVASLVNVIILLLTIDSLGVHAANFSLSIGYIICIYLRHYQLNKYIRMRFPFREFFVYGSYYILTVILFFEGYFINVMMLLISIVIVMSKYRKTILSFFNHKF